jgi:hypothetical protein
VDNSLSLETDEVRTENVPDIAYVPFNRSSTQGCNVKWRKSHKDRETSFRERGSCNFRDEMPPLF